MNTNDFREAIRLHYEGWGYMKTWPGIHKAFPEDKGKVTFRSVSTSVWRLLTNLQKDKLP